MVEQVIKNIYLINVPLPGNPLKNLNAYFIKGEGRNLLIDTGFNSEICYTALKSGLNELNADMDNTDIFLTHLHTDHIGLCARMASEHTKIYISTTDGEYISRFSDAYWDNLAQGYLALGFGAAELEENMNNNPMRSYLPPKDTRYTYVGDGFEINLGNYIFKTIATPGHTPGHMCLYDEKHKILFSGDHIIFDITPNITTWQGVDNPLKLYIESLKKIKNLDIETTLSAHRAAIGNSGDRIDQLIMHHKSRLNEALQIVRDFPGLTTYEVASKMKWSIRAKDWSEFPVIQKWFAVGEAAAHLTHLLADDLIMREIKDGVFIYNIKSLLN